MPSKLVTCNICCLHQLYSVFIHLLFLMAYIQKENYLNWRGRHIWHFFLLKQDIRSQININDLSHPCWNLKSTRTLSWDSWKQLFFFLTTQVISNKSNSKYKVLCSGYYIYFSVSILEKALEKEKNFIYFFIFQYKILRNIHIHMLSRNIHIHTCVHVY